MKSMRQILSMFLCLILLLSCTSVLAEEEHGPLWIGDYELTYWMPISGEQAQHYTTLADHPFYQWMEEQTGVHVEFVHPSWEQMDQQLNLMITSGNYYDMLYSPNYQEGSQASIDDGIYVDLNLYKDLMPDYYAAINCADGSFAEWEWGVEKELYNLSPSRPFADYTFTIEGNMWCVTQTWTEDTPPENGALIRQDWLDEAGLPMPQTLEDLEKVLAAFKAKGEDVIPMSLDIWGYNWSSGFLVTAFEVYPGYWTVHDNQIDQHGMTVPAFKDYLTLMNKWYELGYIDPDFMNRDADGLVSLFLQDRLGIMVDTYNIPSYMEFLYSGEDENFDVSAMPLPRMTTDQQLHWRQYYEPSPINFTCVTAACEIPEVAAQWLNVGFTKEGILRASYGVEGQSYVIDEETGAPYFTDWYMNNPDGYTIDQLREIYLMPNASNYYSSRAFFFQQGDIEAQKTTISEELQTSLIWGENADSSMDIGYVSYPGNGWGEANAPYVEADTYAAAMIIKFVIGDEPLENFDEYAQKALDLGFAKSRDLTQAAFDQMPCNK